MIQKTRFNGLFSSISCRHRSRCLSSAYHATIRQGTFVSMPPLVEANTSFISSNFGVHKSISCEARSIIEKSSKHLFPSASLVNASLSVSCRRKQMKQMFCKLFAYSAVESEKVIHSKRESHSLQERTSFTPRENVTRSQ